MLSYPNDKEAKDGDFESWIIFKNEILFGRHSSCGVGMPVGWVHIRSPDRGGEPLKQCPQELGLDTGERSVALVSIETDLLFDEFYLLLEKDDGVKFLMELRPRKFGMPSSENVTGHSRFSRFKAKPFCYDIPPGNYHITKVIGVFRSSGPAGAGMSEENVEYNYNREFTAPLNCAIN